jgi:ATP-dependent protease ClpP protease subunit
MSQKPYQIFSVNSQTKAEHEFVADDGCPFRVYPDGIDLLIFKIYINGEILDSGTYTPLMNLLRSIPATATVFLHINSEGGDLFSALQIVNAIGDCNAEVITVADGLVISAATFIFLSGDKFMIKPNTVMMCHNYSGIISGKGHEIVSRTTFMTGFTDGILHKFYDGFLSDEEILDVVKGKDIWLTVDQIEERVLKMIEHNSDQTQHEKKKKKKKKKTKSK